ncbi:MAG: hypothetical protein ACE5H9_07965 [Anaerolineae bacterium]
MLISLAVPVIAIIPATFIARNISRPIVLLSEETTKLNDFQHSDVHKIKTQVAIERRLD